MPQFEGSVTGDDERQAELQPPLMIYGIIVVDWGRTGENTP
jgi:hypothetical protein